MDGQTLADAGLGKKPCNLVTMASGPAPPAPEAAGYGGVRSRSGGGHEKPSRASGPCAEYGPQVPAA